LRGDFRIGLWLVQPQLNILRGNGETKHVEPKAMQVLTYLAEHFDQVVTKDRIMSAVWADTFVTDDVLTRCISELRKALQDDAKNPQFIETIPRSGYRLIAKMNDAETQLPVAPRLAAKGKWLTVLAGILCLLLLGVALNLGGLRSLLSWRVQPLPIRSLAVLPLANLSGDPEQEYFADGMTEELITDLSKIGVLRVISRTSVIGYKGAHKPLPQIARELNVDAIVEGTVQRSGGRVRVTAQLIEARTDRHLWAKGYERDLRDVLALEGDLASAIAGEIRIKLTPQEHNRVAGARPLDPEAHVEYLQGLYFWGKLDEQDLNKSIAHFQKAIQLAPDYAPAYSGLAFSYNLLASSEFAPSQENYTQAKMFAQKAIELDETLADAHAALGFALCYGDWNWPAAEKEFQRANALEPGGAGGHHVYALYLGDMGRIDEAIAEMKRDLEANPLSVLTLRNLGSLYEQAGQQEKAMEEFRKITELDANSEDAHWSLGNAYRLQGRHSQAIAEFQQARTLSGDSPWDIAGLGLVYAAAGQRQQAYKILDELQELSKRRYVSSYLIASIYASLGDKEQAFFWLGKSLAAHEDALVSLKVDSVFAGLRNDPRFQELIRRIGLP
jgi:TolB-like protein/DNA-binding winged helix-turn-helix (wHTH) protein/Tfp pilus assembly protein PilF